jgi:hypothetical protein
MSDSRFSVLLYYRQGLSSVLALLFQGSEVHSANSHSWLATVAVLLGYCYHDVGATMTAA